MESKKNVSFSPHTPGEGKRPLDLIAPLMQSATSMRQVDEIFLWLANAIVQQWGIPIVQFWAGQMYRTGQARAELRAASSSDTSVLRQVHINVEIAVLVNRLLEGQRDVIVLPVANIFPSRQAYLLAQSDLHYWTGYFLRQSASLSSMKNRSAAEKVALPLNIVVSLFTREFPSQELLRAISFLTGQGLRIAEGCGFFAPVTPISASVDYPEARPSLEKSLRPARLILDDLIPSWAEDIEKLQANNPFGRALIISDKNARRLYSAIDGQKDIAQLAHEVNIDLRELIKALRYLLEQGRIQLHKPGGEAIDNASILLHLA